MTTNTRSLPSQNMSRNPIQPSHEQARMAFFILLVINILNYMDRSVLSAVQTIIQTEFGLTDTELGLLSSSFLFVYGIATLPLGIWADRGVRKNIVAICVTIWSCATAIGGLTINFIQLFLSRSVLGIGEAGYAPASLSLIGDYFPKEKRGRMLSIWSIGNLIGTAMGLALGGIVAEALGWRWVFYIVGIPGLLMAFYIWRVVEPKRGASERADGEIDEVGANQEDSSKVRAKQPLHTSKNWLGIITLSVVGAALFHLPGLLIKFLIKLSTSLYRVAKQFFHIPTYWVLVVAFICSFFIVGAALAWIPTYVERYFLLPKSQATGIASGVLAGGSLIGTLAGGWLADFLQQRMRQGRMLVAAIAFLVGAPLTGIALSIHTLPYFIAVFALAIICLSLCLGPIQAVIQDITPPDIRSTAVGLALLAGHLLGDASSPLLLGVLSQRFTPPEIVQALALHQSLSPEQKQAMGHALGQAFLITGPTCLFLAGIACLIGLRTVAKDMDKMQRQLHEKH